LNHFSLTVRSTETRLNWKPVWAPPRPPEKPSFSAFICARIAFSETFPVTPSGEMT
jgi:hypothetical protein